MSEDEKMLIDERYKYLRRMQRRYAKGAFPKLELHPAGRALWRCAPS